MASLKKPDCKLKEKAGVASKTKSAQFPGLAPKFKARFDEMEPGQETDTIEDLKAATFLTVTQEDNGSANLKDSAETQSAVEDVHRVQPAQQTLPDPHAEIDLKFDLPQHVEQGENASENLKVPAAAMSLGPAKPDGKKLRDHLAGLEKFDHNCASLAEPESETYAEFKLVLSPSLQTTEKDGPKTVTDKIQKKQAHAATTEKPVIADATLDLSQEKAQTKAGSAKATAKKSTLSQTSAGQKDVNSAIAACEMSAEPSVSEPASVEGQVKAQIDIAPEASAEEKAANAAKQAKAPAPRQIFKESEFIVYPAHGVGQIIAIEEQEVAGFKLELFVISFVKDKMILKVPVPKAVSVRMRKLADAVVVKKSLDTLTGRARIKRTMWSRRAQEYEAKINSGDLISIAEVVRDLYRSSAQPEQSYSERQLYEAALDRMAREIAAVEKLSEVEAFTLLDTQLQKSPRRVKGDAPEAEEADVDEDGNTIEEAA